MIKSSQKIQPKKKYFSGKKVCDSALEGYNGTIFAYGQTGTDIYNGR
jgi:hypothetical protein